jgi:hypothetical protein
MLPQGRPSKLEPGRKDLLLREASDAGCHCEVDRRLRSQAAEITGGMDMQPQLLAPDSGHYEVASDDGAENWAVLASLIETAKLNSIDPQAWLADVLTRLVNLWPNNRLDELLPWAWSAARQQQQRAA